MIIQSDAIFQVCSSSSCGASRLSIPVYNSYISISDGSVPSRRSSAFSISSTSSSKSLMAISVSSSSMASTIAPSVSGSVHSEVDSDSEPPYIEDACIFVKRSPHVNTTVYKGTNPGVVKKSEGNIDLVSTHPIARMLLYNAKHFSISHLGAGISSEKPKGVTKDFGVSINGFSHPVYCRFSSVCHQDQSRCRRSRNRCSFSSRVLFPKIFRAFQT